jgi:hypothetical protein
MVRFRWSLHALSRRSISCGDRCLRFGEFDKIDIGGFQAWLAREGVWDDLETAALLDEQTLRQSRRADRAASGAFIIPAPSRGLPNPAQSTPALAVDYCQCSMPLCLT